jgi:glycosyltransferase involved in cell wall biosynthesis
MTSRTGRSVFSYPGVMQHAQQAALALHEISELDAYVTAFVFRERGALAHLLRTGRVPGGARLLRQLQRRALNELPDDKIHSYPLWELLRSIADRGGASAITVDRLWDRMALSFDQAVARHHVPGAQAIHAFEYTALESFRIAGCEGVRRVLHLPSLDSRWTETVRQRETQARPELKQPENSYFEGKFAERYERRLQEISLAEIVVANSSLTARSHIAAGADPAKMKIVPLGCPPVPHGINAQAADLGRPLAVLWAGTFKPGKGAHYFLAAWKQLASRTHARAVVYGSVEMPYRVLHPVPPDLEFRASVPQPELLAAMERADVLVFPTLADGFGMVVSEALSRGLPVIVTHEAGASDLIEHGKNGLVIPAGDASALKDALQWCLDNRAALARMRDAALATARANQWSDYRARLRRAVGIVDTAKGMQ